MDEIRAQIEHLTDDEKVALIEALFESLRRGQPDVRPDAAEIALMEQRLAEALADPEGGRDWEEVLADLERDL